MVQPLDRTMKDLVEMRKGVSSAAIVPVGLTKYREGLYPLHSYTRQEAETLIDQVEAFAAVCREKFGSGMFWCSDEFYLLAERPIPEDAFYEDYCQLENGVGMLRLLQMEFEGALRTMDELTEPVRPFSIATGYSARLCCPDWRIRRQQSAAGWSTTYIPYAMIFSAQRSQWLVW